LPVEPTSWKVVPVTLEMTQGPLAAVLPPTPEIVTNMPLLKPAVLGAVMTIGEALLAPVIPLLTGLVGSVAPADQRLVVGL